MPAAATSQTVRVSFQRVSLVDPEIYYFEWNALTTDPAVYKAVESHLKADGNFENVFVSVYTVV